MGQYFQLCEIKYIASLKIKKNLTDRTIVYEI